MRKVTVVVCLLVFITGSQAFAQLAFDKVQSYSNTGDTKPWVIPLTVADNPNRLLVVGISKEESGGSAGLNKITSITYNGSPLTKTVDGGVANSSTANDNEFWLMVNPPAGAHDIVVTYTNNSTVNIPHLVLYSIYNAKQTNLYTTALNTSLATDAPISATVNNVAAGSFILDFATSGQDSNVYTAQSGQTISIDIGPDIGNQMSMGGYIIAPTTGDYTLTYNPDRTCFRQSIVVLVVEEVPQGSGGGGLWTADGDDISFSTGNVGIGTSTPSVELEVNGTIRSEEVRVEAVNAPDYVFEADYDLRSLGEVEKHIEEFGHLPEVPSAAELEEKGMGVSEMNLLLLKKIEELTLHAIRQEELLQEQSRLLEMQQGQINSLRKGRKR